MKTINGILYANTSEIADLVGVNRATVRTRAARHGIAPITDGNDSLYPVHQMVVLREVPPEVMETLKSVQTRLALASAESIEIQNETSRGERIPIEEVEAIFEELFAGIRGRVEASSMPEDEKERLFAGLREIAVKLDR